VGIIILYIQETSKGTHSDRPPHVTVESEFHLISRNMLDMLAEKRVLYYQLVGDNSKASCLFSSFFSSHIPFLFLSFLFIYPFVYLTSFSFVFFYLSPSPVAFLYIFLSLFIPLIRLLSFLFVVSFFHSFVSITIPLFAFISIFSLYFFFFVLFFLNLLFNSFLRSYFSCYN
jgi:hypothetical protein